ncbi:phosphonate degradation HD-domain oxygenase [Streptacidiphilus jiangxiensis]|uniref:Gamma-butyrobetaine dioxygenase n=1 Tax=Streptacidiphilus jiangxiensis TaxID=235985 RepID=A0A1H7HQC6_STRJI|nr:phosphonate degradation HD-domain oxygenase [Streptacidiphilus jiangxiensis]SEK52374.1 gamma-butyrobetaine dioxygenase [Streptacidiphilus jiangxiensis]
MLTPQQVVDILANLFDGEGADDYLGEDVTQAEHMFQAAALAAAEQAPPALVAAALLHDVGHFRGAVHGRELMAGERDNRHSHQGADWLAPWFGPDVTEPIRLHVAAKRYLCAAEPDYFARLSAASVHTLSLQGGPMTPAEADRFAAEPYATDAVRLRRWDDDAKDVTVAVPGFDHYRALLAELVVGP